MERARAFRTLAVVLSLLAALGAAEALLRLVGEGAGERPTPVVQRRDPSARADPDFRERPAPGAKPPGVFRLVAVGDSYTWGAGVYPEDAYPARLERRLAALAPGAKVEVVSWSRPGWNTRLEVASLARAMDALEADGIVLAYCLNDVEPTQREQLESLHGEYLSDILNPPPLPRLADWSRVVQRLTLAWRSFASRRAVRSYYRSLYAPGREGVDDGFAALAELVKLAETRALPLVMVVFPIFDSPMYPSYPYRDLHERVLAEAQRIGLPAMDLLPCYAGIDTHRLAVTPFTDPHPNELAHRIAADRILDYLIRQAWVPMEADGLDRYRYARRRMGRVPGCGARERIFSPRASRGAAPSPQPED